MLSVNDSYASNVKSSEILLSDSTRILFEIRSFSPDRLTSVHSKDPANVDDLGKNGLRLSGELFKILQMQSD